MKNIQHTRLALRDLDQIWDYIARDHPAAADHFLDKIQAKGEMLARQPLIGEAREDLGQSACPRTTSEFPNGPRFSPEGDRG